MTSSTSAAVNTVARGFIAALLFAASIAAPVRAQVTPAASAPPAAAPAKKVIQPDEAALQTHKHYVNKSGQDVHSPAQSIDGKAPAGASAKCRDGSYSFSKHHSGTCSHHGGVATWTQ